MALALPAGPFCGKHCKFACHATDIPGRKNLRRRKRRLWVWLLLLPMLLGLAAAGVGAIMVLLMRAEFLEMAEQFDLDRLSDGIGIAHLRPQRENDGQDLHPEPDPVPYEKLPQTLVQAVVAAEDQRFWSHDGVDYYGIACAALANWSSGRIRQGASTVTQQLARNSFDLKERTYRRKLLEMALAQRIEKRFPKEKSWNCI